MPNRKIIVSVSNDLSNDQRVHRVCTSLQEFGFEVCLTGRKLRKSPIISRDYKTKRFHLLFNKGILFYACLNARLFWYAIFHKYDIILSNDLDTLSGLAFANLFKRKKLIYDSHELFTEVPELQNKTLKKKVWLKLEALFIKKAKAHYTVCQPIADYYNELYKIDMKVVRNLPFSSQFPDDYEKRENILIYQGALNKDRGIDLMIDAMQYIPDYKLLIAGKGDLEKELQNQVEELSLQDRVIFTGNLDFKELQKITKTAKIGFSLEQGTSLNYKYALPNKIFDYIQYGVPVLCSNLPEMSKIITDFKVGQSVNCKTGKELANIIAELISKPDLLTDYHKNCKDAAKELNWENEEQYLKKLFDYNVIIYFVCTKLGNNITIHSNHFPFDHKP